MPKPPVEVGRKFFKNIFEKCLNALGEGYIKCVPAAFCRFSRDLALGAGQSRGVVVMASRQETFKRKQALVSNLREAYRAGRGLHGEAALSQRELGARYGLSMKTVGAELQQLVREGVLYTIPRVGTFVRGINPLDAPMYLFLTPDAGQFLPYVGQVFRGYEERLAQWGGTVLLLTRSEWEEHRGSRDLPAFAGVFDMGDVLGEAASLGEISRVRFADSPVEAPRCDVIGFDDEGGGRAATEHLLALGHTRIAFVGLHLSGRADLFAWSQTRENGWREMMERCGQSWEGLAFHPNTQGDSQGVHDQAPLAQEAARKYVAEATSKGITAVVAANVFGARALFRALQEAKIPKASWPSVVCFDSLDDLDSHAISALRLPWDEVGRAGAQLVWDRSHGKISGPSRAQLLPLPLIPRLTCRPDWAHSGLAARRLEASFALNPVSVPI